MEPKFEKSWKLIYQDNSIFTSTDGTWEYLQENKVPSHRLDTDDSFDLRVLQNDIVETIHREKPDWVIYNGCDLFPVTMEPLHDALSRLDSRGFNLAQIECVNFFVGESYLNN